MKFSKSKLIKYLKFCGLIFGILVIFLFIIYGVLPLILESSLRNIIEKSGLGKFSGSARRVTLTDFDLSSITLGNPDKPYASINSVTADYSLWALLRGKKSESLALSGVEINCSYDGKNIVFPGLDISKITKNLQSSQESGDAIISVIEVKNSVLNFNYCGKPLNIPFKIKYFPGKKWTDGYVELELSVREQVLNIKLTCDEKSANGTVYIRNLDPEVFYDFFPQGERLAGLHLSDILLDFAIANECVAGTAKANIKTPLLVEPKSKAVIPIPLAFKYCSSFSGKWEAACESHLDSIMFKSEKITSVLNLPTFFVNFSVSKESGSASLELKSDLVSAPFPSGSISLNNTSLSAAVQFNGKNISGEASFNAFSIEALPFQAVVKSPSISFPFKLLTDSAPVKKGSFSISNISIKNIDIGAVSGELQQIGSLIAFTATAPNVILQNMAAKFNGTCGMDKDNVFGANIFFSIPKYKITAPISINKWIPLPAEMIYQGEHEIKDGVFKISPSTIESGLKLNISNSTLDIQTNEGSTIASGISLDLEIKDILNLKSAPSQPLKINKLTLGTITIENIIILFNIENLESILIEAIRAKWCDGNVSVQSTRINPFIANYSPIIFCDRISFAKVIEQLNIGKAEGKGTLNGTIPMTVKDGKIDFYNGFLYSAPGTKGKIKVEGGAIGSMTAGLTKANPMLSELTLTQMALRDFDYEWVKLRLNSEGENLIIKLQLNGKPAKILPFDYKMEYGHLVSVDTTTSGSVLQGLTLNVNIKIPFNKFMLYNKWIQGIIKEEE